MTETTKRENIIEAEDVEQPKAKMSDEKFKRIVVALTVGAVVFLSCLIIFMCYQLIKIGVEKRKINELNVKITEAEQLYDDGEKQLEYLRTKGAIERLARELGYHYSDDIG